PAVRRAHLSRVPGAANRQSPLPWHRLHVRIGRCRRSRPRRHTRRCGATRAKVRRRRHRACAGPRAWPRAARSFLGVEIAIRLKKSTDLVARIDRSRAEAEKPRATMAGARTPYIEISASAAAHRALYASAERR